jgi:DNA invertase Pin-like site-specific DNA recombinase
VVDGHIVTGFLESNLTYSAGEGTVTGQRVAYTRVRTLGDYTARQLDGLAVDRTFTDSASGKDVNRPQLAAMLGFVREGDIVVMHSMDRLARNLDDLRRVVRELTSIGVHVQFVKEQLMFTGQDTAMANLLLSVMGAFAEFERALIGERQREGITLAKQRGAYRGRKKSLTEDRVTQLRQRAGAGEAKSSLAREFGISRETVYQYLRAGP